MTLNSFTAEELLLSMTDFQQVFSALKRETIGQDNNESDTLAELLLKHWPRNHDDDQNSKGPSLRYLRALLRQYIREVGSEVAESSEALLQVILDDVQQKQCTAMPNPNEYCHVAFRIASSSRRKTTSRMLRIRIFPHHNDVGTRIWEAGAALAEYLVANPTLVQDQRVVELGAGTGVTSLVASAQQARHVYCTDFTEASLDNMQYNFELNQRWLEEQTNEVISCKEELEKRISSGYLEWGGACEDNDDYRDVRIDRSLEFMRKSNVLLAADVAYDTSVIGPLVETISNFLRQSTTNASTKTAILACTLRNHATFGLLQKKLVEQGIKVTLVLDDCSSLPMLFPLKFVQPRSDVKIYSLQTTTEN